MQVKYLQTSIGPSGPNYVADQIATVSDATGAALVAAQTAVQVFVNVVPTSSIQEVLVALLAYARNGTAIPTSITAGPWS